MPWAKFFVLAGVLRGLNFAAAQPGEQIVEIFAACCEYFRNLEPILIKRNTESKLGIVNYQLTMALLHK
jgi:hypothetical protein